jgi:hypothetical protein
MAVSRTVGFLLMGYTEMVRFAAHSDGKALVPDEPVELPKGRKFLVTLEPTVPDEHEDATSPDWLRTAIALSRRMPDGLPDDLAEQHDHYIHGTPKR